MSYTPTTVPGANFGGGTTIVNGVVVPDFGAGQTADTSQTTADEQLLGLPSNGPKSALLSEAVPGLNSGQDPFGIGEPITRGTGANGAVTIGDLFDYIQALPTGELAQVQADLANAGYYGKLDTAAGEPVWGQFGTTDRSAMLNFLTDVAAQGQSKSPQSIENLLAGRQAQFGSSQSTLSSLPPIRESGKNYNVINLDPSQAGDMVDQAALKVYGHTLDGSTRAQYAQWLNQMYTQRQQNAYAGQTAMDNANAQADAYASALVDPSTGRVVDYNLITSTARQFLGVPYLWGGTDPAKGLDCSGFVQLVYSKLGKQLPRTSQDMWSKAGGTKFTSMNDAQPGDLVFFQGAPEQGAPAGPGHVGIYIGNGMMINAPHTGARVQVDSVSSFGGLIGFEHFNDMSATQMANTNATAGMQANDLPTVGSAADFRMADENNGQIPTDNNQQIAFQYLVSKGLTPAAAAGIVGNLLQESNINPEDPGGGIAQWLGGRWDPSLQTGDATKDLNAQLGHLWDELSSGGQGLTVQDLNSAQSASDAAALFSSSFERPGNPMLQNRQNYANQVYQKATAGSWNDAAVTGQNGSVSVPGAAGSTITSINGRTIVSTPDTVTNSVDQSGAAMQAALEARLRAADPAKAGAQDTVTAYGMLAKVLRDGITVNNN